MININSNVEPLEKTFEINPENRKTETQRYNEDINIEEIRKFWNTLQSYLKTPYYYFEIDVEKENGIWASLTEIANVLGITRQALWKKVRTGGGYIARKGPNGIELFVTGSLKHRILLRRSRKEKETLISLAITLDKRKFFELAPRPMRTLIEEKDPENITIKVDVEAKYFKKLLTKAEIPKKMRSLIALND
ncbi:MAG: hypothetical protein N3A69_14710 [Leptospiraceae bacterium]|nr:hypothetical protein [Leptospiraceae bacterium]